MSHFGEMIYVKIFDSVKYVNFTIQTERINATNPFLV